MKDKVFTQVLQVGIVVRNTQSAVENFKNLLGIENWHFNKVDTKDEIGENFHTRNRPIAAKANIAWTNLGMVEIELIEPLDERSVYAEHLKAHGPGLHHIMFETSNYAQCKDYMSENGVSEMAGGELQNTRFALFDMREQLGLICEVAEGGALVPDSSDMVSKEEKN